MINLSDYKRVHFIGIGGCSMSGLAQILQKQGYVVSGSDARSGLFFDTLIKRGIPAVLGHAAQNVEQVDLVVRTAAIKEDNVEYARALELGIPVIERSELLGLISGEYSEVTAIAGCHGKTTITSMLALITTKNEADATVHVGGMVSFLSGGVSLGTSDSFITEACEYVKSFLTLHPKYTLINNIDDDHLDYYRDINEILDAFKEFVALLPKDGILFYNSDDEYTLEVVQTSDVAKISYSLNDEGSDYRLKNIEFDAMGNPSFDMIHAGELLGRVRLSVPGVHNAFNAMAAIVLGMNIFEISFDDCAKALEGYTLAGRRFELFGERSGVKMFHDYAHHPSEIKACLDAAKHYPHKKLYVVFQCNSFTRARTLKDKYATSFEDADVVLMPDLYPGRDIDKGDIHARDIVHLINEHSGNCVYLPTFEDISDHLHTRLEPGDIVVTLGSGDVNRQQIVLLEE